MKSPERQGRMPETEFEDLASKEIPADEDSRNEFKEFVAYGEWAKESGRLNDRRAAGKAEKAKMHRSVDRAVCAMGNRDGGFVYLGVRNDGTPVGLERDMKLLGFTSYEDSLANHIANSLNSLIKDKLFLLKKIKIGFRRVGSITICIIQILPSSKPLFLHGSDKEFYVRGSVPCDQKLDGAEMDEYIRDRFRVVRDENIERDQSDVIQEMSRISSGTIKSISKTIRNATIPLRDRVLEIEQALAKRGRVAVTGEKGSGKSVLLCHAYKRLTKERPVFFVRCDHHLDAESFEVLDKSIICGRSFVDALYEVSRQSKPVVIFDSIDAISRNKKAMNALRHMLTKIWGNGRIQTVVSIRSYDYEYSSIISATDWGEEYVLKPLADLELAQVLQDLGNPNVPYKLKKLLYNPFRLKLLSLILEKTPDADFASIQHETDLYDMHWHECVEKGDLASNTRDMLYGVSQKMTALQHVSIPYEDFGDHDLMDQICSKNILNRNEGLLGFFHHAYLDYVMSRYIISSHA